MIVYSDSLEKIRLENLQGFFVGWPSPPTPETLYKLLEGSDEFILAVDDENNKVVGFITAITDNVLSAYIPLVEVLPDYQKHGIGKELMEKMLEKLQDFYMIDTSCDENLKSFYSQFGMQEAVAMIKRNYDKQSGRK